MAQIAKIVDLNKSYLPIDPQAFAQNLSYTAQEDTPEKGLPIVCFEGYNFLPTSYGYRSYFGTETELTLDALPKLCDKIFMIQSKTYENMIVALCSDGVYTASVGSNAWTKVLSLTDTWTASGIYSQYTFCIIENILYIYRQGHSAVLRIKDDLTNDTFVPSFLNMTGQMGIFRANGRLAFWDSEDSVAWSSAFDLTDFTPSIENLVGNSTFFGVLGRIVTILPHGEGFIIYSTKSVVGVSYSNSATNIWDAMVITSISGIAHPKAVCIGSTVKEHFVYTTNGIAKVGHFNALSRQYEVEYILPELYDFLKEARDPVAVECHAARYLHFCVIDPDYINGRTIFTDVVVPGLAAPVIAVDTSLWDTYAALPYIDPKETFQMVNSQLWRGYNVTLTDRDADVYEAPTYCATFNVPNINSRATSPKYIDNNSVWFKKPTTPELVVINGATIAAAVFYRYRYVAGGDAFGFIVYEIMNALVANYAARNKHTVINPYSGTEYRCPEASFYPKLYPSDILGQGNSCEDLLYYVTAMVKEYAAACEEEYASIVSEINSLNSSSPLIHTVYSAGTISITNPPPFYRRYIPKSGVTIAMGMRAPVNQAQANLPHLVYSAGISHLSEINNSACSSLVTATTTAPLAECNPEYMVQLIEMWGQNPQVYGLTKYFDHMPTIQELDDMFDDPAYHITAIGYADPATAGHKFRFTHRPSFVSTSTYSYFMATSSGNTWNWIYAEDLNNGLFYGNFVLYVQPCIRQQTVLGLSTPVRCLGSQTYDAAYPYLCLPSYFTGSGSDLDLACAELTHDRWRQGINTTGFTPGTYRTVPTILISFVIEIDHTKPTGYSVLADSTILLWAHVREVGTVDWVYAAILKFIPREINKHTVSTDLNFALLPTNIEAATNYSTDPMYPSGSAYNMLPDFNILFTQTGIDEIRKSVPVAQVVPKATQFTPTVTNPGDGQALVFSPLNHAGGGMWHIPYGLVYSTLECIPVRIGDRVDGYSGQKVVNGQNYMIHSEGRTLDVNHKLGALPAINDSDSACYPDMDYSGWVTAKVDFTYPGSTYQIQDGVPVPGYPSYSGSIVFDLHLKKWGKNANMFKALMEFSPMNATDNAIIPYTNFGMDSGIIKENGKLSLFSQIPEHSMMRYGKFGLYRLGFTEALEFVLHFRTPSSGTIVVDGSIDGRDLDTRIQHTETFTNVRSHIVKCHVNAMWQTLTISGQFDLQFMEFRGIIAARR